MIRTRLMYKSTSNNQTMSQSSIPSMIVKDARIGFKYRNYQSLCLVIPGRFKIKGGNKNFSNTSGDNSIHTYCGNAAGPLIDSNVWLKDGNTDIIMRKNAMKTNHNLIAGMLDVVGYLYMNERYNVLNSLVTGNVYPLEYSVYEKLATKEMKEVFCDELGREFILRSVQLFDHGLIEFVKENKHRWVDQNGNLKGCDAFFDTLDQNKYKLPKNIQTLKQVLMGSVSLDLKQTLSLSFFSFLSIYLKHFIKYKQTLQ